MTSIRKMLALLTAGALGLAGLTFASSPAGAQEFFVGGSSAMWQTNVLGALASMTTVTKVYRLCATGPKMGTSGTNSCAGGAGLPVAGGVNGNPTSQLQNFIVIEGQMRNCGGSCAVGTSTTTPSATLGTPSGGFARIYISANGSDQAVLCTSSPKQPTGFLGIDGADGILGTSDDPGNGNAMGVNGPSNGVGIPTQWPGQSTPCNGDNGQGLTYDLSCLTRAPLVTCSTGITSLIALLPAASQPTNSSAGNEFCVVDADANDDGVIGNPISPVNPQLAGRPLHFTDIASTETSNLALNCTYGLSDVPPVNFQDNSLNSLKMDTQTSVGAIIFKIAVSSDVRPSGLTFAGDSANKISLAMPQLQGVFGTANGASDACSWKDVGAQVTDDAAAKINVCFREDGSGTRETFRNEFMLRKNAQHPMGVTAGTNACDQIDEGGTTDTNTVKNYVLANGSGNETNCLEGIGVGSGLTGRVGYVNASTRDSTAAPNKRFYGMPIFGIDPDAVSTLQLQNFVKCGQYPFWGPEQGGHGAAADPGGFIAMLQNALLTVPLWNDSNAKDFISAGNGTDGTAFSKTDVAGQYFVQFQSATCDSDIPVTTDGTGKFVTLPPGN